VELLDLGILLAYLAATLGLGIYVGRRSKSARDFTTGGGRLPGWALGLSIFGTYVSAFSFLALPGKSFDTNWNFFVFSLTIPLLAWVAVRWLVPFYRGLGNISAYEHLENRFGPWARLYAVACYLFIQLGRIGGILYLLAVALQPVTGLSIPLLITLAATIVVIYTFLGGMEAVVWTDVVQSIILIGGALTCGILLLFSLPDGPGRLFEIADQNDKFALGSFDFDLAKSTFWIVLLFGLFENLRNFGADQSYIQRYQSARDVKDANKSVWLGALLYLPVSAVFFFIGTALFAYYETSPHLLPRELAAQPDKVFPHYIATALPVGLAGLLIAAVAAAAQSTISSSLNCGATLILNDVYQRFLNRKASEQTSLRVLRITTVIYGLLGTAAALAMIRVKTALDIWWQIAGIFGGGILGVILLGRLTRATSGQAALATGAGVVIIAGRSLFPDRVLPFLHPLFTIVLGTVTILGCGWLLSRIAPARR
jgi:SSS family solute:Na+ symporter